MYYYVCHCIGFPRRLYGADHWNQGCLRMEWLLESLAHAPQIYDIRFRPSVMDVLE